ncbi:MAG TPA: hypothetical protein EYH06_03475 [Chromatiales bacterium]|nr:hypothetical protein [Thiotrichales bacterium]HIP67632.1 hypothetical protein [Chromatiales bacterium]
MKTREVGKELAELTAEYKKSLSDKHEEISTLTRQLKQCDWTDTALIHQLYQQIHKLAGSAGSYGFDQISETAIVIDSLIKTYKTGKGLDQKKVSAGLERLLELLQAEYDVR